MHRFTNNHEAMHRLRMQKMAEMAAQREAAQQAIRPSLNDNESMDKSTD